MELDEARDQGLSDWQEWYAQDKARRWLSDNLRRARFFRLTDAEVISEFRRITEHHDPGGLLDALCDLVDRRQRRFQRSVAVVLDRLALEYPGPGSDAVIVDRAIRRLLHRLASPVGRTVAIRCLRSTRRVRRMAAWGFYRRHGLDASSREYVASGIAIGHEGNDEYRKLVVGDSELVMRIGPQIAIDLAPNRYWRSKVIETVLVCDPDLAERFCVSHPAEWLWAVSRQHRDELLPTVFALLDENRTDVDLVNRVLLCAVELGSKAAMDVAISVAEDALALPAQPPPTDMDVERRVLGGATAV